MTWQRVKIELPSGFDEKTRRKIGEDIIEFIKDRCAQGEGVRQHGSHFRTYSFPGYSKEYAKKKGSTKVDLVLDDEMLNAIEVLSTPKDAVWIGFENGTKENDKAEGNQLGSYGREPNPRKARRFLGVTTEELNAILAGYD